MKRRYAKHKSPNNPFSKLLRGRSTPPFLLLFALGGAIGYFIGQNDQPRWTGSQNPNPKVAACFTPGGQCQKLILQEITKATSTIHVQTYSFTSKEIANALIEAQSRGVQVSVLTDKSQFHEKHSQVPRLKASKIPVIIDDMPGIAHNKTIIVDGRRVITGSYNFTNAAEYRNSENLLLISDPEMARIYLRNWQTRANSAKIP